MNTYKVTLISYGDEFVEFFKSKKEFSNGELTYVAKDCVLETKKQKGYLDFNYFYDIMASKYDLKATTIISTEINT